MAHANDHPEEKYTLRAGNLEGIGGWHREKGGNCYVSHVLTIRDKETELKITPLRHLGRKVLKTWSMTRGNAAGVGEGRKIKITNLESVVNKEELSLG